MSTGADKNNKKNDVNNKKNVLIKKRDVKRHLFFNIQTAGK